MKKYLKFIVIALILTAGITSCFKEDVVLTEKAFTYNRPLNLAVPIMTTSVMAMDLLNLMQDTNDADALIQTNENGLLFVNYNTPINYAWNDVIKMERITYTNDFDLSAGLKSTNALQIYDSIPINFLANQRYDEMKFETFNLSLDISSVNGLDADYAIVFPGIVKEDGGVIDSVIFYGNISTPLSESKDLQGYVAEFVHSAAGKISSLVFRIDMQDPTIDPTVDPSEVESSIDVFMTLEDISPEYLTGYFGSVKPLNEEFNIDIPIFESLDISELAAFKGIKMDIDLQNYFGIPVNLELGNMFMSKASGEQLEVIFLDSNIIALEGAEFQQPVVPNHEEIVLDFTNSNIEEAINFFPNKIKFDAIVQTNPYGEDVDNVNFLSQTNEFEGNIGIYVPFWFKTELYKRSFNFPLKLGEMLTVDEEGLDPIDYVENVFLYFRLKNAFPFNIDLQIYPKNAADVVIDSLFETPETLFKAAAVNEVDAVDTTLIEPYDFTISVTKEQLKKFRDSNVTKLSIKTIISTKNESSEEAEFVKLHDYNFLDCKFMFEIKSVNE